MSSTIQFRFQCPLAGQQFFFNIGELFILCSYSSHFFNIFLIMQLQFRFFPSYLFMQLQFFFAGINSATVFCGRVTLAESVPIRVYQRRTPPLLCNVVDIDTRLPSAHFICSKRQFVGAFPNKHLWVPFFSFRPWTPSLPSSILLQGHDDCRLV